MRKKIQTFLIFLLILTTDVALGKSNKIKANKLNLNKHNNLKEKPDNDRIKRSLNDDEDRPFWPNRGKKQIDDDPDFNEKYNNGMEYSQKVTKSNEKLVKDLPFWGNRGRRDGSIENFMDYDSEYFLKHCDQCVEVPLKSSQFKSIKDRREDFVSPFWGSRGRRNSLEVEDLSEPFWGNRGRRLENEPFWGNRGRRTENEPFWGNRGRREEEPFWGNRGRREDVEPFWGNRGRRQDSEPFWDNRGRRQDPEPFWGNRGRRQDSEPFWGNRGRREDEPFWGNRGRRKDTELRTQNRKEELKNSILSAINDVESDSDHLSRLKKTVTSNSFWANRGRENKLALLFNGPSRFRGFIPKTERVIRGKTAEPGTVLDNRMYVDEPNYILVERTGRSSAEEDPYYISRGKKYYFNYSLEQAARDRRGAIEEIVKSVRNDPYYIARGKKDSFPKNVTSTLVQEDFMKAKELICAAIDLIMIKSDGSKVKREISDNDRDRRTTLKKLAAQLQVDPYFVSRGKKNDAAGEDYLREFISDVAEKCN